MKNCYKEKYKIRKYYDRNSDCQIQYYQFENNTYYVNRLMFKSIKK